MHIIVEPTRILIGTDFVPRFLDLPKVKQVAAGEHWTPGPDETWDYIEVAGMLMLPRDRDTKLTFTHLFILPDGHLDCGTEADPIHADKRVEFIMRDVPVDTTRDPFQWGNGLLNFGHQDRCGAPKLAWTTATDSLAATQTTITLADDPIGWAVGDELLIPDTDFLVTVPRREPRVVIKAIAGHLVTLEKPLAFDHFAQFDPDGNIVGMPYVANLTRNVILRSENPAGTRGHTANVGHHGMWCHCYNALSGLGRTKNLPLDSVVVDQGAIVHVGTNQVGRYTDHQHHAMGFGSMSVGNVYRGDGSNGGKWGSAVHGTHDARIESNIAIDFPGAGFVTEDGYEVRNHFTKNFAAYISGNRVGNPPDISRANVERFNNPGSEGNGYWFRGLKNYFTGNVAINNSIGLNFFNILGVQGSYPSQPGGEPDTPLDQKTTPALAIADNVTNSNQFAGLEYWGMSEVRNDNHVSVYNGEQQILIEVSDPMFPWFHNPLSVGKGGTAIGLFSQAAYIPRLRVEGGRIVGNSMGIGPNGGAGQLLVTDTVFQNVTNFDLAGELPILMDLVNVKHVPLAGFPPRYIIFGQGHVWNGTGEFPQEHLNRSHWTVQRGSPWLIHNWQGTGKDYRLLQRQSLGSLPVWPSSGRGQFEWCCPEAGITMQQAWDKYGQSFDGDVIDTKAVALEGLLNGMAVEGVTAALGVPRLIITLPNARDKAVVDPANGAITVHGIVTGSYGATISTFARASVDGGTPFFVGIYDDFKPELRRFWIQGAGTTEGTHTIATWRVTPADVKIPGSDMLFIYHVGVAPPPEMVTVPDVTGNTETDATTVLTAAGLPSSVTSVVNPNLAHIVKEQSPAAGSSVPKGTNVNLSVLIG